MTPHMKESQENGLHGRQKLISGLAKQQHQRNVFLTMSCGQTEVVEAPSHLTLLLLQILKSGWAKTEEQWCSGPPQVKCSVGGFGGKRNPELCSTF